MNNPDGNSPELLIAWEFMRDKGYPDLCPIRTDIPEKDVWVFTYQLPEGELDLCVEYFPEEGLWDVGVDDFRLA